MPASPPTARRLRRRPAFLPVLAALVAAPLLAPAEARAQNFFEQLFGLRPSAPPVPPGAVPGARNPYAAPPPGPGGPAPSGDPAEGVVRNSPAPPAPPKPTPVKAPNDADVLGRDLQQNGSAGTLRLERAASGFTGKVTLSGSKISNPVEACSVPLNRGEAIPLVDKGRPEGLTRLEAGVPACPLRFEILDGAVLATLEGESDMCTFQAQDCQVEPKGLWGPAPATLLPRAGEFESARGPADRAVRENFKVLGQRAGTAGIRTVVAEQAAFSADREQVCRNYGREAAHGFCHLRFTEARGLSLATRLGIGPAATGPVAATPRPRRRPEQMVIDDPQ
jgi:hypothetical protein